MKIFLSHASKEKHAALEFKKFVNELTDSKIDIFISSDYESLIAGSSWFDQLHSAIKSADMMIVLCSSYSIKQQWLLFEAGAAWALNTPVVPLCYQGMNVSNLDPPFAIFEGIEFGKHGSIERLAHSLEFHLKCECTEPASKDSIFVSMLSLGNQFIKISIGNATAIDTADTLLVSISQNASKEIRTRAKLIGLLENGAIKLELSKNTDIDSLGEALIGLGCSFEFVN